jgi:hypothetical protein
MGAVRVNAPEDLHRPAVFVLGEPFSFLCNAEQRHVVHVAQHAHVLLRLQDRTRSKSNE